MKKILLLLLRVMLRHHKEVINVDSAMMTITTTAITTMNEEKLLMLLRKRLHLTARTKMIVRTLLIHNTVKVTTSIIPILVCIIHMLVNTNTNSDKPIRR